MQPREMSIRDAGWHAECWAAVGAEHEPVPEEPMNPADSVELIGRLGAAPEIKPAAAGRMLIINLAVQVVSFGTDANGERRSTEKTSWLRVISFDSRIIARAQGLEKDDLIAVRGYPERRMFEGRPAPVRH